jgi:hypothetical protein
MCFKVCSTPSVLDCVVECGPSPDILSQSLTVLLDTMLQFGQPTRSFARALEGLDEHLGKIVPTIIVVGRQLIEPASRGSFQHEGKMLHR